MKMTLAMITEVIHYVEELLAKYEKKLADVPQQQQLITLQMVDLHCLNYNWHLNVHK